ncbi:MAG: hypothetical protein ACKVP7_02955 [Hyphomicrobiaceae bacterium]
MIFNFENLLGSGVNDTLTGSTAANVLWGGDGSDVLIGAAGADTLDGGAGVDFFVFNPALGAANIDQISGYVVADDTIRLENGIMTGLGATTGTMTAAAYFTGAAAGDASDRIIYNSGTGALLYDADGTGATAAIQFATLSTGLVMSNLEFVII